MQEVVLVRKTEEPEWKPYKKADLVIEEAQKKQKEVEAKMKEQEEMDQRQKDKEQEIIKAQKEKEEEQKRIDIYNKIMNSN